VRTVEKVDMARMDRNHLPSSNQENEDKPRVRSYEEKVCAIVAQGRETSLQSRM